MPRETASKATTAATGLSRGTAGRTLKLADRVGDRKGSAPTGPRLESRRKRILSRHHFSGGHGRPGNDYHAADRRRDNSGWLIHSGSGGKGSRMKLINSVRHHPHELLLEALGIAFDLHRVGHEGVVFVNRDARLRKRRRPIADMRGDVPCQQRRIPRESRNQLEELAGTGGVQRAV